MIRTKSILNRTGYEEDGHRLCIMRYVKPFYNYDTWIPNLAPSKSLLSQYQGQKIPWKKFRERYISEMSIRIVEIARLRHRSDRGEVITLLCWEWSAQECHRAICKNLIDNCCIFVSKTNKGELL